MQSWSALATVLSTSVQPVKSTTAGEAAGTSVATAIDGRRFVASSWRSIHSATTVSSLTWSQQPTKSITY